MDTSAYSSRDFNQDTSGAKRAAEKGPVFITDRGRPAHVLLSIDDYRRLTDDGTTIAELLSLPGSEDIDFDPQPLGPLVRPADFG